MKNNATLYLCLLVSLCVTPPLPAQKYVQVWGDDFNTPGLPDRTKWGYEVGRVRNNELQYYTYERQENARVENGVLIIEAKKESFADAEYTSASLISRGIGDWLYGKIEIRAKVPTGKGTWPALWMMPTYSEYGGWPRSGEIDIMEYIGVEPQNLYYTAHFEGTDGSGHQSSGSGRIEDILDPFDQFITFTLVWTPEKLQWYANSVKYHEYEKPADDHRLWPFDKEFYLILNLAYGGNWGGYAGVDDTQLPHQFLIDYVKVYQWQETAGPFVLAVEPAAGGTVEVSPELDRYPENTEVTLTAIPDAHHIFKTWRHFSGANPYTFTLRKDTALIPHFIHKDELLSNGDFYRAYWPWRFYVYDQQTAAYTACIGEDALVVDINESPGID